jgi:hypothetical protein
MRKKPVKPPIQLDPEKVIEQVSHVTVNGKSAAAVALGRLGGASTSERKRRAVIENAKLATIARKRNAKERRKMQERNASAQD